MKENRLVGLFFFVCCVVIFIAGGGWTFVPRPVGAARSHAAIVARDMGYPAVVGCGNATMLLKTGDRVRVDGGRGTVETWSR